MRNALVIAQVALAVVLITAAGLTTKSLLRLLSVDMGFNPDNALVVSMGVPDRYSETPGAALTYYESVLEAIRRVPGVRAVGSVRDLPTQGNGEMRKPDPVGSTTVQPGQSPPVRSRRWANCPYRRTSRTSPGWEYRASWRATRSSSAGRSSSLTRASSLRTHCNRP